MVLCQGARHAQAPVGTTLALLERSMKVMSGVQARMHAAMKNELRLLARIIRDYMPAEYAYEMDGDFDRQRDFDARVDVIPVSDPNAATMSQRIMQYQAAMQLSQTAPQMYNLPELHRQMLDVLGIKDTDEIVPLQDDIKPVDPVSAVQNILSGKPVKAFPYQDHDAHIQTVMSAQQNPEILELLQQSPNAGAIQAAVQAHIAEHIAFQYRVEIEKMMGVPLPPIDEKLPEDVEVELSRVVAMASDKLLQKGQAEAQQQQAQQQAEDPVIQMQKAELELKQARFQHDKAMDEAELNLKSQEAVAKDERENKRIDTQAEIEGAKIAIDSIEAEQKMQEGKEREERQDFKEGVRIGLERADIKSDEGGN